MNHNEQNTKTKTAYDVRERIIIGLKFKPEQYHFDGVMRFGHFHIIIITTINFPNIVSLGVSNSSPLSR